MTRPPADPAFTITLFPDYAAQSLRTITTTLPELARLATETRAPAKAALPWLKLATFGDQRTARGSLRSNANVRQITGVEGDYDGQKIQPREAAALLSAAGISALIYTSPSHLPDLPRWRVICPAAHPLPPASRLELLGRVNHALDGILAGESFTLSQAYYYGQTPDSLAPEFHVVAGQCVDLLDLPARYPESKRSVAIPLPPPVAGQTPDERTAQALAVAVGAFTTLEQDRHTTLLSTTNLLAPFVASGHLSYESVVDALSEACTASGREPNPGEVEGCLTGALRTAIPYVAATGDEFGDPEYALPAEPAPIRLLEFTEDHAARQFAGVHAKTVKYDHSEKAWYVFTREGWEADKKSCITEMAREFLYAQREQWGLEDKDALRAAGSSFINNAVSLCRSDRRLATTSSDWDLDLFALGVPGGHVDLHTGEMHAATPSKMMRRRTSVAPAGGPSPVWTRFLAEATGGDATLSAWLQRFAGYVLTGDMSEEMLAFVYGPGKNGKGVFLRTLSAVLGGYAYQAPAALFDTVGKVNREYQLAGLEGVRLLMVSETEAGSMLAEAFVKEITGNEGPLNARHPYGRPFTFRSQAKVLIVGNHAPKLNGRSEAMERRLRVVPFNNKPPVQDHTLKDKLVSEYPQILQWMIDGCVAWRANRLGTCSAIRAASTSYFEEQDTVAQWVAERCDLSNHQARTSSGVLLEDFNSWLRVRGERPTNAKDFKEMITQRYPQHPYTRAASGVVVAGLALAPCLGGLLD